MSNSQKLLEKKGLVVVTKQEYNELNKKVSLLEGALNKLIDKAQEMGEKAFDRAWEDTRPLMIKSIIEILSENGLLNEEAVDKLSS